MLECLPKSAGCEVIFGGNFFFWSLFFSFKKQRLDIETVLLNNTAPCLLPHTPGQGSALDVKLTPSHSTGEKKPKFALIYVVLVHSAANRNLL